MKGRDKLFLSKLIINLKNKKVRKDLSDCHELHRTVMSAFPNVEKGSNGVRADLGILYRVESNSHSNAATLYVQSNTAPDWDRLLQGYILQELPDNPACKNISNQYASITEGMLLRFKLCANPTRKISSRDADGKLPRQGKRVEIIGEKNQVNWFLRKAEFHGFKIESVRINSEIPDIRVIPGGKKHKLEGSRSEGNGSKKGKNQITLASVIYEGNLRITSKELFEEALKKGIGSGKAYGFGLLSVAPPGL